MAGNLLRLLLLLCGAVAAVASMTYEFDPEAEAEAAWDKGHSVQMSGLCTHIGRSACERASSCDGQTDPRACLNDFGDQCCVHYGICQARVELAEDVQPCLDAYPTFSCSQVAEGTLPDACLAVTRLPQMGDVGRLGEICELMGASACKRSNACGAIDAICRLDYVFRCCAQNDRCGSSVELLADLEPCFDAYFDFSCSEVPDGNLPVACQGMY
jgi:hypothetical protein